MQASTPIRSSTISRGLVVLTAAVLASLAIGAAGGYVAKTLSLSPAAPTSHLSATQLVPSGTRSTSESIVRRQGASAPGFRS